MGLRHARSSLFPKCEGGGCLASSTFFICLDVGVRVKVISVLRLWKSLSREICQSGSVCPAKSVEACFNSTGIWESDLNIWFYVLFHQLVQMDIDVFSYCSVGYFAFLVVHGDKFYCLIYYTEEADVIDNER